MHSVRIIEIPACRMAQSGSGMFGDGVLERFDQWFSQLPREPWPNDYLYWDGQGFRWLYRLRPGQEEPEGIDVVDFPGGLYAVATDIDQQTDMDAMAQAVDAFLDAHGLMRDSSRQELGNVITPPKAHAIMGFQQMDYYTPVKPVNGGQ